MFVLYNHFCMVQLLQFLLKTMTNMLCESNQNMFLVKECVYMEENLKKGTILK